MDIDESVFFVPFFSRLDQLGIEYAVMRNGECLPMTLNGSDLDLIVRKSTMTSVLQTISEIAKECGGGIIGQIIGPSFRELSVMGRVGNRWWGATIDLCGGDYLWEPINCSEILKWREMNNGGVWCLTEKCAHLLGCAKEMTMNRVLPVRYHESAVMAVSDGLASVFNDAFFAKFVMSSVLSGERPSFLKWSVIRLWLVVKGMFCNPLNLIRSFSIFYFSKIKRIIHPCGKMIAVLGTDGAGKSTIIKTIIPLLSLPFHRSIVVHHLKPDFLPPLSRLRGVKPNPGSVCTMPHASKPSGIVGSLSRIVYLLCDYVLGYWFKVRIKLAKLPIGLWMFDRYAYDMMIDPRRFRINLPRWLIRWFIFFVPRPDTVLCLGGAPEVIYARKPEISLEEIKRQVAALKKFCDENQRAVWIDTTKTIEESANAALTAILERIARR